MFIFTWGEIFDVLSSGPYISTRIPASHRGRINGLISVAAAAVAGVIDVTVGQVYDRAGSNWTWMLILAVTLASIVIAAVLMRCDRKAYPKLYLAEKREDAEQTPDARE
jgi:MFS family permease